ncbi:acyl-CoA desaturase [soil metagenome]
MKGQVKFIDKDKSAFYTTLRENVDRYFSDNNISKNANSTMVIKTIVLMTMYLGPLAIISIFHPPFATSILLWGVMGFGLAGIGMSVMHDANHGAYSSNEMVNKVMGHSLILLGGSVFNWKLQHNILHHTYTNITDLDEDIDNKLVLRFSPHTKSHSFHRFQKFYALFFYGIMTLYWCTLKDFIQFAKYARNKVNTKSTGENIQKLTEIIAGKIVYYFVFFWIPVFIAGVPFMEILPGFILMHFIAGIILTVVFQLAHTVEGTDHPMPDENGNIENSWAIHQMNTTKNFSRKNKWISWYVGGLNFQIEHHLFTRICHVHYPKIAPIVKKTAEEFGIPYMENENFFVAIKSHFAVLQKFGKLPDLDTAIG